MWQAGIILVVVVALLHLWFLVLEMFLWARPLGRRVFRTSAEHGQPAHPVAAGAAGGDRRRVVACRLAGEWS